MQLGAQAYTIRAYTQSERDLARALKRVSDIGYRTIQLSAIGPIPVKTIKKLCDDNGLSVVLTHTAEARLLNDLDAVIDEHKLYGCRYVGLGSMNDRYRSQDGPDWFEEDFIPVTQRLKEAGLKFMYHNHSFEFGRLPDGKTLMEELLSRFPADLLGITADTYWLQLAGLDVVEWLEQHRDRLPCVHLKDVTLAGNEQRMAPVLEGNMNFASILKELAGNGVTEHILVEQDTCYESPFVCLEKSYRNIRKLGY